MAIEFQILKKHFSIYQTTQSSPSNQYFINGIMQSNHMANPRKKKLGFC